MTTTTSATGPAPTTSSGREQFFNFAKSAGAVSGAIAAGALVLNNVSNVVLPGDFGAGVSDASNWKVAASSVILGTATTLAVAGEEPLRRDFGRDPKTTAIGVGIAGSAGYAVGNMFTGGWFERGSVYMGAAAVAAAVGVAVGVKLADRRDARIARAGATGTPSTGGRVSGIWTAAKDRFNSALTTPRSRKVVKALGAGALTFGAAEVSNVTNFPFGGFNNTGAVLSAAAVSTGVFFGGKIKEKVGEWNSSHPVITKLGIGAVALGTVGLVALAWNKGWIGGHDGHGKSGAGDHTDKVPTGKGTGTSTSTTTSTSIAPTTTVAPATTAPAVTIPAPTGGGKQTLIDAITTGKPKMVQSIQDMNIPGMTPAKANSIADQISNGQYNAIVENPAGFEKFVNGQNQAFADWAFNKDVATLASA